VGLPNVLNNVIFGSNGAQQGQLLVDTYADYTAVIS